MAGIDLETKVKPRFAEEAKKFINFVKSVGKKYPVEIHYRTVVDGSFYITVDGTPGGKIDALFQELVLNKAVYYYICSENLSPTKIKEVIIPILSGFFQTRFINDYSELLNHHILGRGKLNHIQPGEYSEEIAHQFEILLRRWDIENISTREFINLLDDLLTLFILKRLQYKKGQPSPKFERLLIEMRSKKLIDKRARLSFEKIHKARTLKLHRRQIGLKEEEIFKIVLELDRYFDWVDNMHCQGIKLSIPDEYL